MAVGDEIVPMEMVKATIDDRTTTVCLHAAGMIRQVGPKFPFDTINGKFTKPPFHTHCRSIIIPYSPLLGNEMRAEANAELVKRPQDQRDWRQFEGMPVDASTTHWVGVTDLEVAGSLVDEAYLDALLVQIEAQEQAAALAEEYAKAWAKANPMPSTDDVEAWEAWYKEKMKVAGHEWTPEGIDEAWDHYAAMGEQVAPVTQTTPHVWEGSNYKPPSQTTQQEWEEWMAGEFIDTGVKLPPSEAGANAFMTKQYNTAVYLEGQGLPYSPPDATYTQEAWENSWWANPPPTQAEPQYETWLGQEGPFKAVTGNERDARLRSMQTADRRSWSFTNQYEHETLLRYKGSGYRSINSALRGQTTRPSAIVQGQARALKNVIDRAQPSDFDMNLFRGFRDTGFASGLKPGDVFQDPAFMSATTRRGVAESFSGAGSTATIMEIEVERGARFVSANLTREGTWDSDVTDIEGELIFAPGTRIQVQSVSKDSRGRRVIKGRLVKDD